MSGDIYYDNVSLLLHCDGSNGSTTFTDHSPSPKTVTPTGNAQISTAQSKWGGASALFDGNGDWLNLDGSGDFAFGTGDFTIEFWLRRQTGTARYVYDSRPLSTNGIYPLLFIHSTGVIVYHVNSTNQITGSTVISGSTTWYHVALSRVSGVTRLFIDGNQEGSSYTDSNNYLVGANRPRLGNSGVGNPPGSSEGLNGSLDDIRVTKGVGRYAATFTPPTGAFPDIAAVIWIPVIGTIAITGQTPSIAAGQQLTPAAGQLTITGLIASLPSPEIGALALTGQTPGLSAGFANTPSLGQALLTGQAPALAWGWSAAPAIGQAALTGLTPQHSNYIFHGQPSIGEIGFNGLQAGYALGFTAASNQGQITESGQTPSFANRVLYAIADQWISTHYRCYLTGAPDSLADLELPISSFQTRMAASPVPRAYLSVIVPGVDAYIDAINARPNGRLKVDRIYNYLDGSSSTFNMVNVPFDTINTNQGGRSGMTGTLSGFEETGAITAQSIDLFDPVTRSSDNGGIRYRCRLDPRVRPNDTATINGESFDVESIIHIVDAKTAIMEIKEKL